MIDIIITTIDQIYKLKPKMKKMSMSLQVSTMFVNVSWDFFVIELYISYSDWVTKSRNLSKKLPEFGTWRVVLLCQYHDTEYHFASQFPLNPRSSREERAGIQFRRRDWKRREKQTNGRWDA